MVGFSGLWSPGLQRSLADEAVNLRTARVWFRGPLGAPRRCRITAKCKRILPVLKARKGKKRGTVFFRHSENAASAFLKFQGEKPPKKRSRVFSELFLAREVPLQVQGGNYCSRVYMGYLAHKKTPTPLGPP